ncbi:MAG: hypothetical protein ACRDGM_04610, partial [bacterium]
MARAGLVVVVLLALSHRSESSWINAATCSGADIATAVGLANDGDTITIPSGTCSITAKIVIAKSLTMRGAGQGVTIFQDDIVRSGAGVGGIMFQFTPPNGTYVHFSHVTIAQG